MCATLGCMFRQLLRQASHALPSQCVVCHDWGAATLHVCTACVQQFAAPTPRCEGCALPLVAQATHCGACLQQPGALDACFTATDYAYPWDKLLAKLKFNDHGPQGADAALARTFAALMHRQPPIARALGTAHWVAPIPLSLEKLRLRGFNQALEIAKHLPLHGPQLQPQLLLRTRDTPSQVGLGREQRLHNLRHAFALAPEYAAGVQGRSIVLVDDVATTTATLSTAAAALRSAGAARVVGIVFARTPVGREPPVKTVGHSA
jgi:ComF family protein